MKQEEIERFARLITATFETTVLHFADRTQFYGFFIDNPAGEQSHIAQNKWNFVRYNDGKEFNIQTMVNGYDLTEIEIVPRGQ